MYTRNMPTVEVPLMKSSTSAIERVPCRVTTITTSFGAVSPTVSEEVSNFGITFIITYKRDHLLCLKLNHIPSRSPTFNRGDSGPAGPFKYLWVQDVVAAAADTANGHGAILNGQKCFTFGFKKSWKTSLWIEDLGSHKRAKQANSIGQIHGSGKHITCFGLRLMTP